MPWASPNPSPQRIHLIGRAVHAVIPAHPSFFIGGHGPPYKKRIGRAVHAILIGGQGPPQEKRKGVPCAPSSRHIHRFPSAATGRPIHRHNEFIS
jgi:hypothetical protein